MLPSSLHRILGDGLGAVTAGMAYAGSALRGARVFHPRGELYKAEVNPSPVADASAVQLASKLQGRALVRLSASLWKHRNARPEILGAAIRCGWDPADPYGVVGVQDLLFITSKRFLSIPVALLTTDSHDYLDNTYYSILSFGTAAGELEFRLVPQPGRPGRGASRGERLADAVAADQAVFLLQQRAAASSLPFHSEPRWQPVATIRLTSQVNLNDRDLLFSPFHAARGIEPTGLANQMRRLTYRASKAGRSGRNR